jgi:hypothetical protein
MTPRGGAAAAPTAFEEAASGAPDPSTSGSRFPGRIPLGHAIVSFIRAIREICGSNSLP